MEFESVNSTRAKLNEEGKGNSVKSHVAHTASIDYQLWRIKTLIRNNLSSTYPKEPASSVRHCSVTTQNRIDYKAFAQTTQHEAMGTAIFIRKNTNDFRSFTVWVEPSFRPRIGNAQSCRES